MMKAINKVLLTIVALTFSFTLNAQYAGATVEYVKVKPGQWSNYMELEESAKELHQARVEKGIITGWRLFRKLYSANNDPYSHIIVTLNNDFNKTENAWPQGLIDELFTEQEQSEFMEKIWASRDIVKTEYYDRVTFAEDGKDYKYLRFNRYLLVPGSGSFEQIRKDIVKPLFDEVVKRGYHAGWSVWRKDPSDKKFQYVAVNNFAEYGDWKNSVPWEEIFKDVFPDQDMSEASKTVMGSRTLVSSEYWELVMTTESPTEQ